MPTKLSVGLLVFFVVILACFAESKSELLEGKLEVLVSDHFIDGSSQHHVFIHDNSLGKRIALDLSSIGDEIYQLRTGMVGKAFIDTADLEHTKRDALLNEIPNNDLMVDDSTRIKVSRLEWEDSEEAEPGDSIRRAGTPAAWALANLRRLLVIIVDFEDEQVKCDVWNISQTIWGSKTMSDQRDVGPWENIYRVFNQNSRNRLIYARNATALGSSSANRNLRGMAGDFQELELDASIGVDNMQEKSESSSSSSSKRSAAEVREVRDIVGPYRLARSLKAEATCAYNAWAEEALKMALDANVEVTQYNQVSFVLPDSQLLHSTLCRWTGLAHVGCGFLCRSWISDCTSLGVFAHELGHNAGFGHAGSYWAHKAPYVEYGDPTSIMSNQWGYKENRNIDFYFNVVHRKQLGWLTADHILTLSSAAAPDNARLGYYPSYSQYLASIPHLNTENSDFKAWSLESTFFAPTTARIFRITPFHTPSLAGTTQALMIERYGTTTRYWVSYETGNVKYPNRALVHYQATPSSSQTYIIYTIVPRYDLTKNISTNVETTLYRDPELNFALRVLRSSSEFMDVMVTWECERRAPEIYITSQTPTATILDQESRDHIVVAIQPSVQLFTFSISVYSLNSDMCAASIFVITTTGADLKCTKPDLVVRSGFSCSASCTLSVSNNQMSYLIQVVEKDVVSGEIVASTTTSLEIVDTNCKKNPPILELVSPATVTSIDSQPVSATVKITNSDSTSCKARSIDLYGEITETWTLSMPASTAAISPGKSVELIVQATPGLQTELGSKATIQLKADGGNTTLLEFSALSLSSCIRVPPLMQIENVAVSFYSRSAAYAPLKLTNRDPQNSNCSPTRFLISILPDELRLLQTAIYPDNGIELKPGEQFEFVLTVAVPNNANAPFGVHQIAQTVILDSPHHERQNFTQFTYNLVNPCTARPISMGLNCPTVNQLTERTKVFDFVCYFAWRNNDNFLCPPTTFNLTINPTEVGLTGRIDARPYFIEAKANFLEDRVLPGATMYYSVTVSLNFTGLYDELSSENATASTLAMALKAEAADVSEGNPGHYGITATGALLFGFCLPPPDTPITVSSNTGPYGVIVFLPANNSSPSSNFSTSPNESSPDHTESSGEQEWPAIDAIPFEVIPSPVDFFEPETSNVTEPSADAPVEVPTWPNDGLIRYPVVTMAHGLTRWLNWTISNPSNQFCAKTLYEIYVAPESMRKLASIGAKYTLTPVTLASGTDADLGMLLTLPQFPLPENQSGLVNITIQGRFLFNGTRILTAPRTVFLNASGECIVRPPQLTLPKNPELSSPTYDATSFPPRFLAKSGVRQTFYTVVNLTNMDTPACANWSFGSAPSYSFTLRGYYLWNGLKNAIDVSLAPLALAGGLKNDTDPTSGAAGEEIQLDELRSAQSRLFNMTFELPDTIIPGTYYVEVASSTDGLSQHSVAIVVRFDVASSAPPLPPFDFYGVELTSGLGVSLGYDLQWRACEASGDCLCPCTYMLLRNGAFLDEVNTTRYTLRYSLAQAGVTTTLQVIVKDALGRNSSLNACSTLFTFTPVDSSYGHLFIFFVICGVVAFPGLVLLLEWLRSRNLLPLSYVQFRYDPEAHAEMEEIPEEVDAEIGPSAQD